MNTAVYLIRHGHVDFPIGPTGEPIIYGPSAELSQKGVSQMQRLGQSLRDQGVKIERIYTSPLSRAKSSAQIVHGILEEGSDAHIPLVDVEDLQAVQYPDLVGKRLKDFDGNIFVNESKAEVAKRTWEGFLTVVNKNKGRTIIVVTHGEQIGFLMHRLKNPKDTEPQMDKEIPYGKGLRFPVSPEGRLIGDEYELVDAETTSRGVERR